MQVILVTCVVDVQLLADFSEEGGVVEQIIQRVGDLLNIQVDVTFVIFVASWMQDVIPPFSFLAQDYDQSIQIFDQQRQL